jgi:hypothetical protein
MSEFQLYLLQYVVPIILACSLIEGFFFQIKSKFDWFAMFVSLSDFTARLFFQYFLPLSIASPFLNWAESHPLVRFELSGGLAFLAIFLIQDFCYYWMHRASHRVRWFWCNHAVHHSSNELNLSAAYRLGIFGKQMGTLIFFLPLVLMGFSSKVVYEIVTFNLLYQFWLHATWIPKLGFLEKVINTPSLHRIHHASNKEYIDGNYGGVLIIFDRLFRTYKPERDDLVIQYGLTKPILSRNPIVVQFHEWGNLFSDLKRAQSAREFLGFLFKHPGWQPNRT